jgi:hypothetical protein
MNKTIQFNGVDVTCYDNGSIEWVELKHGKPHLTFGYDTGMGYMKAQVGRKQVRVHRLIAKAFLGDYCNGLQVDHINGVKSDNRPGNLRMATASQNMRGKLIKKIYSSSHYRGVSWSKAKEKWSTTAHMNGKRSFIGLFTSEKDAAKSRDAVAYANGYTAESLNFGAREAQELLLCAIAVNQNQ